MATFVVIISNPIINNEVMRIETDNYALALSEAAYFSTRHGIASVVDNSSNVEVARFRYGAEVELPVQAERTD
jgi:hypothetical protein